MRLIRLLEGVLIKLKFEIKVAMVEKILTPPCSYRNISRLNFPRAISKLSKCHLGNLSQMASQTYDC